MSLNSPEAEKARSALAIVPAFNEAGSVGQVVASLRERPFVDILVVDDGSTDDTANAARLSGASVITFPHNLGIGAALRAGFLAAWRSGYSIAFQFDADGQHQVESVNDLLKPIEDGRADIVIGSRFLTDTDYAVSGGRRAAMRATALILRSATGLRLSDPTSGFRGFSAKAIEAFATEYPIDYMDSTEAIAIGHARGLRIMEVPAKMANRQHGAPSNNLVRSAWHTLRALFAVFALYWEPFSSRRSKS